MSLFGGIKNFLFGKEQKKDTQYTGPQAPGSIYNTQIGQQLADLIMQRMQGSGVGYDPAFVSRSTSPVVQARQQRYTDYELPELQSALSARGMNRSTLAGDLIRRTGAQKEQDIASILAEAYRAQEIAKNQDIAQALGLGQNLLSQELGQQNLAAQSGYNDYLTQLGIAQRQQPNYAGLFGIASGFSPYIYNIFDYLKNKNKNT